MEKTLEAPNRWTEQALAHALNRRMQSLTADALSAWLGPPSPSDQTVGVVHGGAGPLNGFRMALAAWGLGRPYVGALADASPSILPAFADEVSDALPESRIQFAGREEVIETADVVMGCADSAEEADELRQQCDAQGLSSAHRLIQSPTYSVGVIDGHETDDERERLAEDMLLFDGTGRRRLAVLWAPKGLEPDAYLESMAHFRGLYPVHPDTPGTLQMQQAFLEAQDQSHAYAEGLEFLVSRGEPAPQKPGHIRWAEYEDPAEVEAWMQEHSPEVYGLVARQHIHDQFSLDCPVRAPGGVHGPPLDDPEGQAVVACLRGATS